MSDPAPTHSDDAPDELVPDPQVARDAAQTGTGRWKNRRSESSHADLDELAQRIKEEHSNVACALHQGFMHASAAGELLIQAKGKAGHGKWSPWLRDECNISMRTASLYMRLAKNRKGILISP